MKIKVANYIADFFVEKGISHVFTVTGGGAMHLNDALGHKKELTSIYNHHEQASAIAAEGYARLTGKVATVCVTSGPGGTNAITGVLGGWQDSIPMFIISGQVKRETTTWSTDVPLRQLGDQEFQIVDSVKNMTKYAVMITEPNEIKYHLEKAWYLCMNGRKGPVWLDIPLDVQASIIDTEELKKYDENEDSITQNPIYDEKITKELFERIRCSKRPVIMAGTGVRLSGAYEEFLKVVDKLNIPVVTAWNANDLLEEEHPLYVGRPGTVGLRGGNFVVQNSDLLIVFGCRLNIRQISYNYKEFAKKAYKIVVDIDEAELRKPTVNIDMPVNADVKDVFKSILKYNCKEKYNHYEWIRWCKEIHNEYPAVQKKFYINKKNVNPYVFVKKLFEKLSENDCIVCGNGSACVVTFQAANIKRGQRLFTNSGCAAMGYGFPAAIGCCVGRTNHDRVICIDGDGSFQMNIQELQTVVYNKFNLKIIIMNNNGYHSIRQTQTNLFKGQPLIGVSSDNGISFPNMEKVSNAYDISYIKIDSLSEIDTKLDEFLNTRGPIVCEVILDTKQNFEPKLSSKVLPDGKIVSPDIDDMFPFLDREEYNKNKFYD